MERFAHIQLDLTGALEVYEDDDLPWSMCIDDLEMFFLVMKKEGKKPTDFIRFLNLREKLQGRVMCHDETEIFGHFLRTGFTKEDETGNELIPLPVNSADIFDYYYQYKGLGLPNEKNIQMKTSGKYIAIGDMRD